MADEKGWVWQMSVLRAQFPGLPLTSGYRAGATVRGSGNASYHARGRAVDVPPRMDVFEWIRTNYPTSRELIYSPAGNRQIRNGAPFVYTGVTKADHYSHIHWAIIEQVSDGATPGGTATPAGLTGNPIDDAINLVNLYNSISGFVAFILDPGNWMRIGIAVGGAVLIMVGLFRLTNIPVSAVSKVVSSG